MQSHDLSLRQASERLGKSLSTIRRFVKTNKIESYLNDQGRRMLRYESLQDFMHTYANDLAITEKRPKNTQEESSNGIIETLRQTLDYERHRGERLQTQVEELQNELFKIVQEMKALLDDKKSQWKLPFRWVKI